MVMAADWIEVGGGEPNGTVDVETWLSIKPLALAMI